MASIERYRSGYSVRYRANGKQIRESFKSLKAAKDRVAELGRQSTPSIAWDDAIQVLTVWSRRQGRKDSTLHNELDRLRLARYDIHSLTTATIRDLQRHLDKFTGSNSTHNNSLYALRSLYKALIAEGYVVDNPAMQVSLKRVDSKVPDVVDFDTIGKIIGAFSGVNRVMAEFVGTTGCRIGEACGLKWVDVQLPKVIIRAPKEHYDKVLVLPQSLCESIMGLPRNSEYVFPNESGNQQLNPQGLIRNACKRAGIANVHWHQLRHTVASHLVMHHPLPVVQRQLGHRQLATTERYIHINAAQLQEVAATTLSAIHTKVCHTQ